MTSIRCLIALCATILSLPTPAHITLTHPAGRSGTLSVGASPCGVHIPPGRGPARRFLPGETIEVRWTETVSHPGHFRISFDDAGQEDFVDPSAYDDLYAAESVLLDDIPDGSFNQSGHSASITFPEIECDQCTLQLMQVNTDRPPFGDGNDLHWACADITLTPDAHILLLDGFE